MENGLIGDRVGAILSKGDNNNSEETRTMDRNIEFATFVLKSRFEYNLNLKLAFILIFCKQANISQITRIMDKSRAVVYKIIYNNPSFNSQWNKGHTREGGGHQRNVSLSNQAQKFTPEIEELSISRLGNSVCEELKLAAKNILRGAHGLSEEEIRVKYAQQLNYLSSQYRHPNFQKFLKIASKKFNKSRKEILIDLEREIVIKNGRETKPLGGVTKCSKGL